MFAPKIDPFSELLRPPLHFESASHQHAHMKQVGQALSWVDDLDYPVLIADAMVCDCPIIAVSEGFVRESLYSRADILYGNCRIMIERVAGNDLYQISRSSRENVAAFCKMSRFPGAVDSGGAVRASQPNVLGDGTCVTNHFVVFRVYVCGHPMLVGLQHFDRTRSHAPPKELDLVIAERISILTKKIIQSENLQNIFKSESKLVEKKTTFGSGLYHGAGVSASLLFFDGGRGVLRQEPQFLPQSGTIFTTSPIPVRSDGSRRMTLRLLTTMSHTWPDEAGLPMGFTQTLPTSSDMTYTKLHLVGRTVGFACIGPMINNSVVKLEGIGKWREKLDIFPLRTLPQPAEGDIITVEITSTGDLKRYHNGVLLHTVETGKTLEDGDWYGAFEVSMNVARVTMLEADPHLDKAQVLNRPERKIAQTIDAERKLAQGKESRDIKHMFTILLLNAWDLSVSIASTRANNPLIEVSNGFHNVTGFRRKDVIGRNCRLLYQASVMSDNDRAAIREAIEMGEHHSAALPNIRADGSVFNNLLDLRTLEIGTDEFDKPVQFIFGIQGEITQSMSLQQWKRGLPTVSETLRRNLGLILQAVQNEFQISDSAHTMINPHPVPFWVDSNEYS